MSEWLSIFLLVVYIISTYYFFFAYAFKKAVIFVMASTTLFAGALVSTKRTESDFHELASNNLNLNSDSSQKKSSYIHNMKDRNIIRITDAKLSNVKVRQHSEGNSLYVINGDIDNNSSYPITTVRLEIRLSDCGLKYKNSECVPVEDSFYVENTILNIKPHTIGQFDTSFAVDYPEHRYEVEVYFMGTELNYKDLAAITAPIDNKKFHYEIICGGGADRDESETEKRDNGKIMLAEALENYQRKDRGC